VAYQRRGKPTPLASGRGPRASSADGESLPGATFAMSRTRSRDCPLYWRRMIRIAKKRSECLSKARWRLRVILAVAALAVAGCNANQAINPSGPADRCANDPDCNPYDPSSYAQNNTGIGR
jgi:hypothetical protein